MRILFAIVLLLLSHSPLAELDERIKVVIEEPVQNERHSGISNLRGYAISPEGMGSFYLSVTSNGPVLNAATLCFRSPRMET